MLNLMYKFVTPIGKANKFQLIVNKIISRITNILYPIYCNKMKTKLINKTEYISNQKIVVSLTSFPARIDNVWLCIQSIMRQTVKADRIILWLADSQFSDESVLPSNLLELKNFGLEIRFCQDLKSYKKIYYTAQEENEAIIITADDDVLYPESWIEDLLETYEKNPNCVCCYRAHEIKFDSEYMPLKYLEWNGLANGVTGPNYRLFPTGVSGVLYPPNTFKNELIDPNLIMSKFPSTDDIWLKCITLKKNMKVVKVNAFNKEFFTIKGSQAETLTKINVDENINDRAIKILLEFYNLNFKNFIDER